MKMEKNGEELQMQVLKAPALKSGTPVVLGVITMEQLAGNYQIPQRDFKRQTGYQREASTARVNKLVADLRLGLVDLPTTLLLNLREFDAGSQLTTVGGELTLRPESDFYVVDGQHRVEALHKLMSEDPARWSNYSLAFVCLLGADESEEMRQFYVVNSTAKAVKTDLALDLLKQQAERDPELMNRLIESSQDWKVRAQSLVEELVRESPVWRNRVRFPGEERDETVISNSGLVTAIRPLLGYEYFSRATTENQAKILDAYWKGIRNVLPEAFDNPLEFGIQKQTGAVVLNQVLITVVELVRSQGRSVLDPESYSNILAEPLGEELQGDSGEGDVVRGIDFWRTGSEGAAGSFSSGAGQRVLAAKIKALLPRPEID
jgi:DGQHR domain-containing protein